MSKSPVVNALIIVFAIIGLLAVLAVVGMGMMHGGMMGMMGMMSMMENPQQMMAACQNMMTAAARP
jgi:hypothetical protein